MLKHSPLITFSKHRNWSESEEAAQNHTAWTEVQADSNKQESGPETPEPQLFQPPLPSRCLRPGALLVRREDTKTQKVVKLAGRAGGH